MNTAVAGFVALLFVMQGVSCWRRAATDPARAPYRTSLAILTLMLAGVGFASHFLLASGALVFSREYGVVIVQGPAAWAALVALLVGIPISAAVAVLVSRALTKSPLRWGWLVAGGAIVAGLAISRVELLDAGADLPAVHGYDIWWPPLLIWVGLCFVDALLATAHVRARSVKALVATALGVGFALWAVRRDRQLLHYADPASMQLWNIALVAGLPLLMGVTVWRYRALCPPHWSVLRSWWVVLAVLAGIAGHQNAGLWLENIRIPVIFGPWFLWGLSVAAAVALAVMIVRARWNAGLLRLPDVGQPGRWDDAIAVAALLSIAVGLSDALFFSRGSAVFDLLFVLVGWAAFVEVASVGPLSEFFSHPFPHRVQVIQTTLSAARGQFSDFGVYLWKRAVELVKWFFDFAKPGIGVLRLIFLGVLLMALAELPHAGKTIVIPFTELGLSEQEGKDFGRMISNRVVNAFGTLAQELEPEVAILQPEDGSRGDSNNKQTFGLVESGDGISRPEAIEGFDFEVWGVKVPVRVVTGVVQGPMRALLGVRVITGSVQKDGPGYLLLANSSDGGIFKVRHPGPDDRTIAANHLAQELAYKLIATLPAMGQTGMSRSWEAQDPYSRGLQAFRKFETGGHHDDLTEAIRYFQSAVELDPKFALAHYRLGLALREDGQPFAATEAFRRSLDGNREFALGYNTLASHIYFNARDIYLEDATNAKTGSMRPDQVQARSLWNDVLRFESARTPVLARAAAHYGLCRMLVDGEPAERETTTPRWDPEYVSHYLAYFHCKRGLQLYAALPTAIRTLPESRWGEGVTWYITGEILNWSSPAEYDASDISWHCSSSSVGNVQTNGTVTTRRLQRSPYTEDALRYFERALALLPDNSNILCRHADAALAGGDMHPMNELYTTSAAHLSLADSLVELSETWDSVSGYSQLALKEYETAIQLDPQNRRALNNASYAIWKWHRESLRFGSGALPPPEVVRQAEARARQAAALAAGKASRADKAIMRDTLGEVLLMQGRSHEAYKELELAVVDAPKHPLFDEIRWDLALAYLCAAAADRRPGWSGQAETGLEIKAASLITTIRQNEARREQRPFTDGKMLDREIAATLCRPGPGTAPEERGFDDEGPYELLNAAVGADGYTPCDHLAVVAYVPAAGSERIGALGLRVWGPGVEDGPRRVFPAPAEAHEASLTLPLPLADTHGLYFAQLESDGVPLSPTISLETRKDAQCSNNRIVLDFRPAGGRQAPGGNEQ